MSSLTLPAPGPVCVWPESALFILLSEPTPSSFPGGRKPHACDKQHPCYAGLGLHCQERHPHPPWSWHLARIFLSAQVLLPEARHSPVTAAGIQAVLNGVGRQTGCRPPILRQCNVQRRCQGPGLARENTAVPRALQLPGSPPGWLGLS